MSKKFFLVLIFLLTIIITSIMTQNSANKTTMNHAKVLFIGASLTVAIPGTSFTDIVKKDYPDNKYVVKGFPGAPLQEIMDKLLITLNRNPNFDVIIIDAGHNDIILPFLKQKPGLHILSKNKKTTNLDNFAEVFKDNLEKVKNRTNAKIFLLNLGCLGENLESDLNKQREYINEQIKIVSSDLDLSVLNVAEEFERVLSDQKSDYFLKNNSNLVLDIIFKKITFWNRFISYKRGLILTIDGVHLNSQGADIYADIIEKVIIE